MASRSLMCIQCESVVTAADADELVVCAGCGVPYQACRCMGCRNAFVAVGDGHQVCPVCGASSQLEPAIPFDNVHGPLGKAMSDVPPPGRPSAQPDHDADWPEPRDLAGALEWFLSILALVVLVLGVWLTVEVHRALSAAHASGRAHTIGVAEVLIFTVVVVSILFALAHLVARGADLRRETDRLRRQLEAHERASQARRRTDP